MRHYFENHGNVAECVRKLCTDFGRREAPSVPYVRQREEPKKCVHPNIAAVAESVCEAPLTSIRRRSQQLNISEPSLKRILHKDLGMTPYKVQLVQELKPIDHPMRIRFAKWACEQLTEDADFFKKIIYFI